MQYVEPSNLTEALQTLSEHGEEAKVLAGGQSLLLMLHLGLVHPAVLVSLQRLPDLAAIAYEPKEGLRLGAMTTQRAIETSPLVRQHCPMLARTSGLIATVRQWLKGNICRCTGYTKIIQAVQDAARKLLVKNV